MTQALNYTPHAIEHMFVMSEKRAMNRMDKAVSMQCRDIMRLLDRAEKFILPEWGRILEDDEWDAVEDLQVPARLPYPVTALEYRCDYEGTDNFDSEHEEQSTKRIALAVETEAMEGLAPFLYHFHTHHFKSDPAPGFYIFPVAYIDVGAIWTPPPAAYYVRRSETFLQDRNSSYCVLPLGQKAYAKCQSEEERNTRMRRDLADEILAVSHLLVALTLDKGNHETLPVSEKANRKRLKKGKRALYEYKVLDIIADVMSSPRKIKGRPQGTHASPRMHKRRGHIRRLANGQSIWIRDTIVGKPGSGQIIKDYSVHE